MNLNISKEWFEKRAALEADLEIGAGLRRYFYGPTMQEIAQEASDAFAARLRTILKGDHEMATNIFAHTPPGASYPEFISVNKHSHDGYSFTVRSPCKEDGSEGEQAAIVLTSEQARALATAIIRDTTLDAG